MQVLSVITPRTSSVALFSAALVLLGATAASACPQAKEAALRSTVTADASGSLQLVADEPAAESDNAADEPNDDDLDAPDVDGEGAGPASDDGAAAPADGADMPPAEGEK